MTTFGKPIIKNNLEIMLPNNKIFVFLPDGVGLRNFCYSNFYDTGKKMDFDIIYWNATPFNVSEFGYKEIKILNSKIHFLTDVFKNAKKHIELCLSVKKFNDSTYTTYRFPFSFSSFKIAIKSVFTKLIIFFFSTEKGLKFINNKINNLERKTPYYKNVIAVLKVEKPAMVFCTNQRATAAIAPLLAAHDLGISTATFIFSWDNVPKATLLVTTDYYFVWSNYMKNELLNYYPEINKNQVIVTGTPQFENHFDVNRIINKEVFFSQNGLNFNKKYICYSGDDVTTCPDDAKYLEDVAIAVEKLNEKGNNLGIVFRRCPVDFSNRYDYVLEKYKNVITPIVPKWQKIVEGWNNILPLKEDLDLQTNTIFYTEMVVNLGSSMVFDYAIFNKPCAYLNYDVTDKIEKNWSVEKIYNYVHFRSMQSKNAVIWLNSADEIANKIETVLTDSSVVVKNAKDWFEIINESKPNLASFRIWNEIKNIVK